jgi:CRP-like cAMP-binding protein
MREFMSKKAGSRRQVKPAFLAEPELCEALQPLSTTVNATKNQTIFRRGDAMKGVYLVEAGKVLLHAGEGLAEIHRMCSAGSLLGLPAAMGNHPYSLTAVCATDATLRFISREEFIDTLNTHPICAIQIVEMLADEVGTLRRSTLGPFRKKPVKRAVL